MHLLCFSSFCSVFIFLAFLFVSFLFMIPLSPVFSFQYLIAKLFHNSVSAQPRCLYPCISIFGRAEWCSSFDLSLLTLTLALVILAVFLFRFFCVLVLNLLLLLFFFLFYSSCAVLQLSPPSVCISSVWGWVFQSACWSEKKGRFCPLQSSKSPAPVLNLVGLLSSFVFWQVGGVEFCWGTWPGQVGR